MILNLTHANFKMLIWPDGNRNLPLKVKALKKANRCAAESYSWSSIKCTDKRLSRLVTWMD